MHYESITIEKLSQFAPINRTDPDAVNAIVAAVVSAGQWDNDAPCVVICGDSLITGSHRSAAANILLKSADHRDLEVVVIDATDHINQYCWDNDCTIDNLDLSNLRALFGDLDINDAIVADIARNQEW